MTLDLAKLDADLARDEGNVLYCYDDATGLPVHAGTTLEGAPTIGIGINLLSITAAESAYLYAGRRDAILADMDRNIPWWRNIPEPAARGLANMAYNGGWTRLSGFVDTLGALARGDYSAASAAVLDSDAARKVPARYQRIAALFQQAAAVS